MDRYTPEDLSLLFPVLKARISKGDIGIVPTDTIYGLSGNALDPGVVSRILLIKKRETPLSVIPHSLDWARMMIDKTQSNLLERCVKEFTGPYTILFKYSGDEQALPDPLHSTGLISFRFPAHWVRSFASFSGIPLITTSVNIHGAPPMTTLQDLPESIEKDVDFVVYEGPLRNPPSRLVNCCEGFPFRISER